MSQSAASSPVLQRPRLRLVKAAQHEPAVPAVLAVAHGAEDSLLAVFPELVSRRVSPCLVAGIEESPDALALALERASGPTLFVVCVTPELPSEAVPAVVQAFGRRRRPFHKLLVLDRVADETFVAQIEAAAAELMAPTPVPSFPELDGFMTGSAESASTQGESETNRIAGYTVRAPVPAVVVEGSGSSRSVGMRDRVPSAPSLSVVDHDQDDIDTAQISVDELPVAPPVSRPSVGSGVWTSRRVQVSAAVAFSVGIGIVPLMLGSVDAPSSELEMTARSLVDATQAVPSTPSPHRIVEPEPEPEPPAVDPLHAAASRGDVIDVGAWWMASVREDKVRWRAAAGRCRRMAVDGTSGFQLPTRGQLWALVRASALPRGRYWTRSLARNTSEPANWVFDSDEGRMVSVPKSGAAQTVCVRAK